jgi:hypothetical protein
MTVELVYRGLDDEELETLSVLRIMRICHKEGLIVIFFKSLIYSWSIYDTESYIVINA